MLAADEDYQMPHLARDEWLKQAQGIAVGRKLRVRHTCGRTPSMDVYNNEDSWSAWCFRCHAGGTVKKEHQTLRKAVQDVDRIGPVPPDTIPLAEAYSFEQAQTWRLLTQKGCPPGVIPEEVLWYSRSARRIMLRSGQRALGRAVDPNRQPKWLMYGDWHGAPKLWVTRAPAGGTEPAPGVRNTWALSEDLLSAFKIAKAIETHAPGSCIGVATTLGTALTDRTLPLFLNSDIMCMYDGDDAGLQGFRAMRQRLAVFGSTVQDLRPATGDPKDTPLEELWTTISCAP